MSEDFGFRSESHKMEDETDSLLRKIDLQICMMRIIRNQIEVALRTRSNVACEPGSNYGKSGYMADVELDDTGQISAIRYDWVEP